jgi:hypothetical protein
MQAARNESVISRAALRLLRSCPSALAAPLLLELEHAVRTSVIEA